jgi:FKBP-type peptidyl-prolyl cis-trans isomerase (trigger factor)
MEELVKNFGFFVVEEKPQRQRATISIGKEYVHALYQEALLSRKKQEKTYGFEKGTTPMQYIEQNFRAHILAHLKELLFSHCVVHQLYDSLTSQKIVVVGDPDLVDIKLSLENNAEFVFQLATANFDKEERWKRVHLKPLARKNYKDLDRQVEHFIHDEQTCEKKSPYTDMIGIDDWVNFEVSLLDGEKKALIPGYKSDLWVRLQSGEDDKNLHELLLGKKVGDQFFSDAVFLQEYVSTTSDIEYGFLVEIKQKLHSSYFSLDLFKHHFELHDDNQVAAKLVEVFSTRNDITLRKETIEGAFKLLNKQYFLILPPHLLLQQQKIVLQAVQSTPDYLVYKALDDFQEKIKSLAEKQLKEAIIIDSIGYQMGITVNSDDICAYLNFLKRPRMANFIHFKIPNPKIEGHEIPLSGALLKKYCFREKTLNRLMREITNETKK